MNGIAIIFITIKLQELGGSGMEKVSVSINIPAIGRKHDFTIPIDMLVKDIVFLIVSILNKEYGIMSDIDDLILIDTFDGMELPLECSFSQIGISDGAELILL